MGTLYAPFYRENRDMTAIFLIKSLKNEGLLLARHRTGSEEALSWSGTSDGCFYISLLFRFPISKINRVSTSIIILQPLEGTKTVAMTRRREQRAARMAECRAEL